MTNPAQLKYLEAMGIPVWVSRDLIQTAGEDPSINALAGDQSNLSHDHVDHLLHNLEAKIESAPSMPSFGEAQKTNTAGSIVAANQTPRLATEIGRTALHTIYACGEQQADWMIIGESPDISSNGQGQPYAGDSGVLLTNMLRAVGISEPRKQAYLVNILKISEQSTDDEKVELNKLLLKKIHQVQPKILLAVGQLAAQNLLNTQEPLARLRGQVHTFPNTQIPLVVTYYPSYLLTKPIDKRKAWDDLKLAMKIVS